jgi:hypothetical protein
LVIDSLSEGLLQDWNKEHGPDLQVRPSNRIVEVNRRRGVAQTLFDVLQSDEILWMVIAANQLQVFYYFDQSTGQTQVEPPHP